MPSKNKSVLVLYKASGRKVSEILFNFSKEIEIYTVVKPQNVFLSKFVNNIKDLDSDVSNVYFLPIDDDHIEALYPFFLGCKNINKKWLNSKSSYFKCLTSKLKFKKLAVECGFSVADVCHQQSFINEDSMYVFKLDRGYGSNGIKFLYGHQLNEMHFSSNDAFVEEFIKFERIIGISGYANKGSVDTFLCHTRIVMKDTFGGASRVCKKVESPSKQLEEAASRVLSKINFSGPFMFEIGISNEKFFLIEFNPRLWGSFSLFLKNFANFFNIQKKVQDQKYLVVWSDFKIKTLLWVVRNFSKNKAFKFSPRLNLYACLILVICILG